jgi:hypothetical protein
MQISNKSAGRLRWRSRGRDLIEQQLLRHRQDSLISQTEIQEDLQRFSSQFTERVAQALEPLTSDHASPLLEQALKRSLLYFSAVVDISAGPIPEVNLLDMVVFVTLSRDAFENHWLPEVFGEAGRALLDVLRCSADEIWNIGAKVLDAQQRDTLRETVRVWQEAHPMQVRVEGIRLSAFSSVAGGARESRLATGLLANVRAATRTADQAVLLGERFMFLAPRIPFIVRLHARLGTLELLGDSAAKLAQLEPVLQRVHELEPMLADASALVGRLTTLAQTASETAGAAQQLTSAAAPLVQTIENLVAGPHDPRTLNVLHASDRLVGKTSRLLQQVSGLATDDPAAALDRATTRMEHVVRRTLWQLATLGAVWILLFWGGYYLTR